MAWFLASSYYTLEYVEIHSLYRCRVCNGAFFLFMKYEFSVVDNVKKSFGTDAISKKKYYDTKTANFQYATLSKQMDYEVLMKYEFLFHLH